MTAVNPVVVLVGLLVLSYLGSFLVASRTSSGAGLAQGSLQPCICNFC